MKKTALIAATAALSSIVTLLPMAASAQGLGGLLPSHASVNTSTNVNANAGANGSEVHTTVVGSVKANAVMHATDKAAKPAPGTDAKTRADQEISRRVTNLNSLASRINEMKMLSADEKSALSATINAQLGALNSLKGTIDADSTTTLKADVQSITKGYRIYALVIPQGRIAAAVDRVATITSSMQQLLPKLQDRITAAQTAGKNVSAAQTAYADMQAKSADANTQAQAALSETVNLKPDNGDATVAASNTIALKDAAAKIKAAAADLKAARADLEVILKAVKGTGASANATTTASTH